jgi:hypothetical protein
MAKECSHDHVEPRSASTIAAAATQTWPRDWETSELGWCGDCERLVWRRANSPPGRKWIVFESLNPRN